MCREYVSYNALCKHYSPASLQLCRVAIDVPQNAFSLLFDCRSRRPKRCKRITQRKISERASICEKCLAAGVTFDKVVWHDNILKQHGYAIPPQPVATANHQHEQHPHQHREHTREIPRTPVQVPKSGKLHKDKPLLVPPSPAKQQQRSNHGSQTVPRSAPLQSRHQGHEPSYASSRPRSQPEIICFPTFGSPAVSSIGSSIPSLSESKATIYGPIIPGVRTMDLSHRSPPTPPKGMYTYQRDLAAAREKYGANNLDAFRNAPEFATGINVTRSPSPTMQQRCSRVIREERLRKGQDLAIDTAARYAQMQKTIEIVHSDFQNRGNPLPTFVHGYRDPSVSTVETDGANTPSPVSPLYLNDGFSDVPLHDVVISPVSETRDGDLGGRGWGMQGNPYADGYVPNPDLRGTKSFQEKPLSQQIDNTIDYWMKG